MQPVVEGCGVDSARSLSGQSDRGPLLLWNNVDMMLSLRSVLAKTVNLRRMKPLCLPSVYG